MQVMKGLLLGEKDGLRMEARSVQYSYSQISASWYLITLARSSKVTSTW